MENRNVAIILGVAVVAVVVYLASSSGAVVSARGESVLEVQPDEFLVSISMEGKGATAQVAKEKLDVVVEETMMALIDAGIDEKQIELVNLNVYQDYDWSSGRRVSKGFVASQQINVRGKDFDSITVVVDAAIDSGALVSYINFELSQERENEYKRTALEAAGEDARRKADAIASGVGKKVGRLVSVQSEEFNYGPYRYYDFAVAEGSAASSDAVEEAVVNINPSDLEVRATIVAQYRLRGF